MSQEWYFVRCPGGPVYRYTLDQLRETYAEGRVNDAWMARRELSRDWVPISSILGHDQRNPPAPPPVPSPGQPMPR